MSFRFLHASDLHLGRSFANIPQPPDGNIRGRLMEARHAAISALANLAAERGAAHVLLAGDSFHTATPSPSVLRQALAAMGEARHVTWWVLPGNHDNLHDAEPLWETILAEAPANLRALTRSAPVEMGGGATLLPCPVAYRASGGDPTEALVHMPSGDGQLRIGLAHGGVTDFSESGERIAPDRDRSARLDYLALGDWHGRMAVSERVHYPGSPEQDRFRHDRHGACLCVTIEAPGAVPLVETVEIGQFLWTERPLVLSPGQDAAAALAQLLPAERRRDTLLRVTVSGRAGLEDRAALLAAAERAAPEFAHFELRSEALATQHDAADLDRIDRPGGALRLAAERLARDAHEGEESGRRAAADALARLYSYVSEASE